MIAVLINTLRAPLGHTQSNKSNASALCTSSLQQVDAKNNNLLYLLPPSTRPTGRSLDSSCWQRKTQVTDTNCLERQMNCFFFDDHCVRVATSSTWTLSVELVDSNVNSICMSVHSFGRTLNLDWTLIRVRLRRSGD